MRFWCSVLLLATLFAVSLCAPSKRIEEDPELTAGYFEGDMVLESKRNGLRNPVYQWPNRTVYYRFAEDYFDDAHRNHILAGMRMIEQASCIRFKEAEPEQTYYVRITGMAGGCYSSVGWGNNVRTYNLQIYPLDEGCFRLGTVVHEFLHTLGFFHMQSAPNRDDYVEIREENLQKGTEHNFDKYDEDYIDMYDSEYDYGSILHYPPYAFSANGEMTIVPLVPEAVNVMGQRRAMTASDINKLNIMYRCPHRT